MRVCLGSFREGVESDPRRANVAGVGPSSLGSRETPRLPVRIHDLGEQSISTPVWFIYRGSLLETARAGSKSRLRATFRSLGCTLGLNQFLGTCPSQNVIGGSSSRTRSPAALLHEIALLPARRDFFQGCEIHDRVAALPEFVHTDRR